MLKINLNIRQILLFFTDDGYKLEKADSLPISTLTSAFVFWIIESFPFWIVFPFPFVVESEMELLDEWVAKGEHHNTVG